MSMNPFWSILETYKHIHCGDKQDLGCRQSLRDHEECHLQPHNAKGN
jgi:hypothetical protein